MSNKSGSEPNEAPNTLAFYGVFGKKKVYLPQWLIKDPRWQKVDGSYHKLSDQEWLVVLTLFRRCQRSKKRPDKTCSKMSVDEIAKLSGLHKSKVSVVHKTLTDIGLMKRVAADKWDLGPAIGKAMENGSYRFRTIPKAVADLVAVKKGPRQRLMAIKHLRLWSAIHDKWVVAKDKLPFLQVATMQGALGCEKVHTVCNTYASAQKAGFLRRFDPPPMKSATFDPTPILKVLRRQAKEAVVSDESIEAVFDRNFVLHHKAHLTDEEFDHYAEGMAEDRVEALRRRIKARASYRSPNDPTWWGIGLRAVHGEKLQADEPEREAELQS